MSQITGPGNDLLQKVVDALDRLREARFKGLHCCSVVAWRDDDDKRLSKHQKEANEWKRQWKGEVVRSMDETH